MNDYACDCDNSSCLGLTLAVAFCWGLIGCGVRRALRQHREASRAARVGADDRWGWLP